MDNINTLNNVELEVNDICFSYHSRQNEIKALDHISFSVEKGEFIAIVGPSGCGKSTLLNIICGLLLPESGQVTFPNGDNTCIGYMLQHDHLFEWRSVYDNLILGLEIQGKKNAETIGSVLEMAELYGLSAFLAKKPSELSGGMRQRAALIRTLALNPSLLLLDEPFSALDYQTRLNVSSDIGALIRKTHKTAILVTHNLSEAISMADHIIVLSRRPSKIRREFDIHLTVSDDDSLLAYRNAPEFQKLFNLIWEELIDDK